VPGATNAAMPEICSALTCFVDWCPSLQSV